MILTLKPILPQIASSLINVIPIRLTCGNYLSFLSFLHTPSNHVIANVLKKKGTSSHLSTSLISTLSS